jgi:hypothetical protein
MKFWLTLIVSTIVISCGLTWAVMYQGAQALPDVMQKTERADPPEIVLGEGVTMSANIIPIAAPDSTVDIQNTVKVPFKNVGKGPLKIQLVTTSCGCIHDLKVDNFALTKEGPPAEIPPGGSGALVFNWTPKIDQAKTPTLKLSADLLINDPRPQFASQTRLEITSKIKPIQ